VPFFYGARDASGRPLTPEGLRHHGEPKGFGSTVIDTMVGRALGGEVQLDYAASGLG
jgi:hypothetical protein